MKFRSRKIADLKISFWDRIPVKKYFRGWVGFQKSYVIFRVGHGKCLRWVGGVKKDQKHAYVIFEWSLIFQNSTTVNILNKKDKNIYSEKKWQYSSNTNYNTFWIVREEHNFFHLESFVKKFEFFRNRWMIGNSAVNFLRILISSVNFSSIFSVWSFVETAIGRINSLNLISSDNCRRAILFSNVTLL